MRRFWLIGSVLIVVLLVSGCDKKPEKSGSGMGAMPSVPVAVMTVNRADTPIVLEFPAKLVSSEMVEVRSKVAGTLMSREYQEGSYVQEGTLLYVIDPAKYEAARDVAQARFSQSERDYERAKTLYENSAISEREYDTAFSSYEIARANLANAMLDLDYTRIKAPIGGFAGIKAQNNGALVAVGTLLTTVTKTSPIHAEFSFSDFSQLKDSVVLSSGSWANPTGIKVNIKSESGKNYPNEGRIDFIDSVVDDTSGSVKARAVVANKLGLLMPGEFVRVVLSGFVRHDVISVPQTAVMQGAQGSFVYVVQDGKAIAKPVKVSSAVGDMFVLDGGLNDGDMVVLNNLLKLRPGVPVAAMMGK